MADNSDFDRCYEEAKLAGQIAFWKYQAFWHRAQLTGRNVDKMSDWKSLEIEFEQARVAENRGRLGHVPPAHEIGS